jgi:hypothetical protein
MKNDKLHLIPQVIIDCAQGLSTTRQDNLRLNYIVRLEAIRDYCDQALKTVDQRPTTLNNRSKKYSRIGLNNV